MESHNNQRKRTICFLLNGQAISGLSDLSLIMSDPFGDRDVKKVSRLQLLYLTFNILAPSASLI